MIFTIDDFNAIKNFSDMFDAESSGLINAMSSFLENKSEAAENNLKIEMCRWLLNSNAPVFTDPLWDDFKGSAVKVAYNAQFDSDLQDTLKASS